MLYFDLIVKSIIIGILFLINPLLAIIVVLLMKLNNKNL